MFDLFEEGIIIARVFVHVFFCAFALALLFCNADDVIYTTKLFSILRVLLVYILSFLSFSFSLSRHRYSCDEDDGGGDGCSLMSLFFLLFKTFVSPPKVKALMLPEDGC